MRDAVRHHFANPPPGSKLRAAIDFGVDISLMAPPDYSDRSGHRADRSFRAILDALHEHQVECIIIGGVALILHGSTRVTWNDGNFTLWTPEFDLDLLASTEDLPSYEAVLPDSVAITTSGGRTFNVLSLDALLRIKKRLNRVKDQLAVPEIEALIEIRELEHDPGDG